MKDTAVPGASAPPPTASATSQPVARRRPRPLRIDRPLILPQTADERLAHALEHLGAERGPRGEVLDLREVRFAPGQAELAIKAGRGRDLAQLVSLLRGYPKTRLVVEGYTDNRGSAQLNQRLSLERAEAVRQALVAHGLSTRVMCTRGRGPTDPVADNATQAGRAKNRRVELVFSNSGGTFATAADQMASGSAG